MSEKAFLENSRACAVGSDRSALATVATLVAAVALFCGTGRGALASAGCSAVNAGGFNVPGNGAGAKTVSGFAAGDQLTFTIAANNSGSWILSTAGFNNLAGSPLFATSGSQTKSYTVTGGGQDTTLTEYSGGLTITASCATLATAPTVTSISPPSGPAAGGGSVAVAGSGLTGVTSVNFGSNAASYTFNSDSSITATPPAGSGTVAVTVTTPGGTSTAEPSRSFHLYHRIRCDARYPRPRSRYRRTRYGARYLRRCCRYRRTRDAACYLRPCCRYRRTRYRARHLRRCWRYRCARRGTRSSRPCCGTRYRRSQHSVCHRCGAISDYFASARSTTTPVAATSGTGTDGTATNRDFADATAVTVPTSHVAELEVTAAASYQNSATCTLVEF